MKKRKQISLVSHKEKINLIPDILNYWKPDM